MMIERLRPSGDYLISTIQDGYRVKMRYSGYTRRTAIAMFRHYLRGLK